MSLDILDDACAIRAFQNASWSGDRHFADLSWADGDFNWDGEVMLADLGILAANFGPVNGPMQAAFGASLSDLIPESTTAGLLLCCLGLQRRRR